VLSTTPETADVSCLKDISKKPIHSDYITFLILVYKELHFNCPCKKCLVKATCDLPFTERCEEYINLVGKYLKLYYDEHYGQYSRTKISRI
jgi:hypothetical protein